MGFDITHSGARRTGEARQCANLVNYASSQVVICHIHFPAAKALYIRVTHMSATTHLVGCGGFECGPHPGRVTGMEPTGNVCATHHSQHACVITHMPLTKAFAKIAVNINGVHRQPYAIFRKLKIVETDMMAIYQVMMQVIIPSQSNQRG
ncbi:Uncharacterised protein [Klebsiella pneumoniae]|nr:Uncharacterised protein [Klebsiella pneumoniae]SSK30365.1 Uncharacterised protein [Klebsiella pneumoniae]SYO73677.1 Uncharacterised protein [Klebsiella pneumoniae]VGB03220.1 Uncharacterised protein [Klebsiella pneumoniae]VGC17763.1 Uncharacterised protein [Klebsiella pneumoniae]